MQSFGVEDAARMPVPELGAGAYAFAVEPENEYQSPAGFVAFEAGPHAVAVSVDAEDGQPGAAAFPAATAIANEVAARLK